MIGIFVTGPLVSLGPGGETLGYRDGFVACQEYKNGLEAQGLSWPDNLLGAFVGE